MFLECTRKSTRAVKVQQQQQGARGACCCLALTILYPHTYIRTLVLQPDCLLACSRTRKTKNENGEKLLNQVFFDDVDDNNKPKQSTAGLSNFSNLEAVKGLLERVQYVEIYLSSFTASAGCKSFTSRVKLELIVICGLINELTWDVEK